MLLPPIHAQSDCEHAVELLPERPLRECHSIPHSLPPSFHQADPPAPPTKDEDVSSRSRSKSVRFALDVRTIQYFNPTEKPSCVHRLHDADGPARLARPISVTPAPSLMEDYHFLLFHRV
ncbi:hypothetical protein BDW59DRAFT_166599 [Aspergillus cavernicola]|uniref:Uncharacterized protein n=1 Tax=Aspergillus cavernicola TaxID=176166 RepID=A0ABR4HL04_9EURO